MYEHTGGEQLTLVKNRRKMCPRKLREKGRPGRVNPTEGARGAE